MASCSRPALPSADLQIATVRTRTVRWPIAGTGAARGRSERASVLVEVTTSDGHVGVGEAAPLPGTSSDTLGGATAGVAALAARAPFAIEATFDAITRLAAELTHTPSARFAIETALLAALASRRCCSIADLLSDPPARALPVAVVVDTPEDARVAVEAGARTLKIKVDRDGDLDRVLAIAVAAPGIRLRLDANRTWPRARVRERLFVLAELPIEFIEEPCIDAHTLLGEPLACPIALDESLPTLSPALIDAALASPGLAALVLKPTLLGGFAPSLALGLLARLAGKAVVITHCLEGPVGTAACAELALALGGIAAGLAPHAALVRWSVQPPQLRPTALVAAAWTPTLDDLVEPKAPRIVIAAPVPATIAEIRDALATRTPIALLNAKLAPAELARQRALVEAAPLPEDTAAVLFTSGSTGSARGVVLSRRAIDAACAASAANLGWKDGDRWLLALSTAHSGGLAVVARCTAAGVPIELLERDADLATALARCTLASLVPAQLVQLLADPAWRSPPGLRAVLLGGAAAPAALLADAAARGVPVLATYGLTETFGQLATAPLDRAGDPSAPLVTLPGASLVAGTREVPARITVAGEMLATCYLDGAPIAPAFVTADLGFVEDGVLHVIGRVDDVIITGGENVHPRQIEEVLAATPGVRAACAFGIADAHWGQVVGAAIAVDGPFDLEAASAHWHAQLPSYARPRQLAIVTGLPQLPGGKVDRRATAALPGRPVSYR